MYSRCECIRISGVSEENTDEAVLDIADKLSIPLKQSGQHLQTNSENQKLRIEIPAPKVKQRSLQDLGYSEGSCESGSYQSQ